MNEINSLLDVIESSLFGRFDEDSKTLYDIVDDEPLLILEEVSNFDRKVKLNKDNPKIQTIIDYVQGDVNG